MNVLRKLYGYWMKLARGLGWVNTRVILFLFFYLVMGPIGLVGRLFGKDFFEDHPKDAASYWHPREPGFSPESLKQQF